MNVPFFRTFQKAPTCEYYIDALVQSMAGLTISQSATPASAKWRLVEIEDSEEDEAVVETPKKKKKKKKAKETKKM